MKKLVDGSSTSEVSHTVDTTRAINSVRVALAAHQRSDMGRSVLRGVGAFVV